MQKLALSYARISSPNDERTASLDSQEDAIVSLLESKGYTVPQDYRFRDKWTGLESIYERQSLIRARGLVSSGAVQAFGVYDTDRLARDPQQLIIIVGDNAKKGVETIFVKMDHETKGRIGEAILYIKGLASALEADAIKDRTMRGRMAIYNSGQFPGYGRCRYGYTWDKETRTRTPDPVTAPIVVRIFQSMADGMAPSEICKQLGDEGIRTPYGKARWTTSGLKVIITERTYYGECVARRTMSTGVKRANGTVRQTARPDDQRITLNDARTEPIVSRELWDSANAALALSSTGPRPTYGKNAHLFLLSGHLWCHCGYRMTCEFRHHRNGKSRAYRCTGGAPSRSEPNGCRASMGAAKLEAKVWDRLAARISDKAWLKEQISQIKKDNREQSIRDDLAALESRKKKLEKSARNLVDTQAEASGSRIMMDALRAKMEEIDKESKSIEASISSLRALLVPYLDIESTLSAMAGTIDRISDHLKSGDVSLEIKRKYVADLDVKVVASKDRCDITIWSGRSLACGDPKTIPCNTLGVSAGSFPSLKVV